MTLSSVESAFSFIKNDGRQLPYEVRLYGGVLIYLFALAFFHALPIYKTVNIIN